MMTTEAKKHVLHAVEKLDIHKSIHGDENVNTRQKNLLERKQSSLWLGQAPLLSNIITI